MQEKCTSKTKLPGEAGEGVYFQFVVESVIPNMFHILPILHNTVMDRIIYIQLMPELSTGLANNYILNDMKYKVKIWFLFFVFFSSLIRRKRPQIYNLHCLLHERFFIPKQRPSHNARENRRWEILSSKSTFYILKSVESPQEEQNLYIRDSKDKHLFPTKSKLCNKKKGKIFFNEIQQEMECLISLN